MQRPRRRHGHEHTLGLTLSNRSMRSSWKLSSRLGSNMRNWNGIAATRSVSSPSRAWCRIASLASRMTSPSRMNPAQWAEPHSRRHSAWHGAAARREQTSSTSLLFVNATVFTAFVAVAVAVADAVATLSVAAAAAVAAAVTYNYRDGAPSACAEVAAHRAVTGWHLCGG